MTEIFNKIGTHVSKQTIKSTKECIDAIYKVREEDINALLENSRKKNSNVSDAIKNINKFQTTNPSGSLEKVLEDSATIIENGIRRGYDSELFKYAEQLLEWIKLKISVVIPEQQRESVVDKLNSKYRIFNYIPEKKITADGVNISTGVIYNMDTFKALVLTKMDDVPKKSAKKQTPPTISSSKPTTKSKKKKTSSSSVEEQVSEGQDTVGSQITTTKSGAIVDYEKRYEELKKVKVIADYSMLSSLYYLHQIVATTKSDVDDNDDIKSLYLSSLENNLLFYKYRNTVIPPYDPTIVVTTDNRGYNIMMHKTNMNNKTYGLFLMDWIEIIHLEEFGSSIMENFVINSETNTTLEIKGHIITSSLFKAQKQTVVKVDIKKTTGPDMKNDILKIYALFNAAFFSDENKGKVIVIYPDPDQSQVVLFEQLKNYKIFLELKTLCGNLNNNTTCDALVNLTPKVLASFKAYDSKELNCGVGVEFKYPSFVDLCRKSKNVDCVVVNSSADINFIKTIVDEKSEEFKFFNGDSTTKIVLDGVNSFFIFALTQTFKLRSKLKFSVGNFTGEIDSGEYTAPDMVRIVQSKIGDDFKITYFTSQCKYHKFKIESSGGGDFTISGLSILGFPCDGKMASSHTSDDDLNLLTQTEGFILASNIDMKILGDNGAKFAIQTDEGKETSFGGISSAQLKSSSIELKVVCVKSENRKKKIEIVELLLNKLFEKLIDTISSQTNFIFYDLKRSLGGTSSLGSGEDVYNSAEDFILFDELGFIRAFPKKLKKRAPMSGGAAVEEKNSVYSSNDKIAKKVEKIYEDENEYYRLDYFKNKTPFNNNGPREVNGTKYIGLMVLSFAQ